VLVHPAAAQTVQLASTKKFQIQTSGCSFSELSVLTRWAMRQNAHTNSNREGAGSVHARRNPFIKTGLAASSEIESPLRRHARRRTRAGLVADIVPSAPQKEPGVAGTSRARVPKNWINMTYTYLPRCGMQRTALSAWGSGGVPWASANSWPRPLHLDIQLGPLAGMSASRYRIGLTHPGA